MERIRDSFPEEEATRDENMEGDREGELDKSPYDNYVNYDIAQTVLESAAMRESQSPAAGGWICMRASPPFTCI